MGVFSAAKIYGASHQQVQRDYLITEKPKFNDISKHSFDIRFFTKSSWSNQNILTKKSDAGIYKISSPALTIVDLIHYQTKLGGVNRLFAALEELTEELTEPDLIELLSWYSNKSTLQRLGFLFEELGVNERFQEIVFSHINTTKYFPVLLSPKTDSKPGTVHNRWKVDVNVKLENDL